MIDPAVRTDGLEVIPRIHEDKASRRRISRFLRFAFLVTVACVAMVPLLTGMIGMVALINAPCADDGTTPGAYGLTYRSIDAPTRSGGSYRAFFIPGAGHPDRQQGTIIIPPPYSGGRSSMLAEGALLAQAGYNVLLYESRSCAGRGPLSLGYRDVDDIGDILVYLQSNADDIEVNQDRIALHGFSSAGAASIMAAARYPQIRAVLAEGGYHNLNEVMGMGDTHGLLESLMVIGMRAAYRFSTGDDSSLLDPLDAIASIPPRAIFLVYGSQEISLAGARAQLAAAQAAHPGTRIALWTVPEANHGGYLTTVGVEEYTRQVLAFYDCSLLETCAAWEAIWP